MPIRILTVGKKPDAWLSDGLQRYHKRLRQPFSLDWAVLPHSSKNEAQARQDESERLLARLKTDDFVVLLDERGKLLDSPSLADVLRTPLETSRSVVLIVGGAYGVDQSLHQRADLVWSLSPLVFPHQLVRLILIEQLYRAQEIVAGRPYHHQ